MRKNKLKIIINFLFIIGLCLICFPLIKNTVTLVKIQKTVVSITADLPEPKENERIELPTIESYLTASSKTVGSGIGEIMIPSQKIDIPIFAGLNNQQMLFGVGAMYPERDVLNENMVLLGHHLSMTDLLLGNIKDMQVDDLIFVSYLTESLQYRVIETKIIAETDLSVLQNTQTPRLTLITCDKPQRTDKRIVVIAEFVCQEKAGAIQEVKNHITQDKRIVQRSIVKYSLIPILIMIFILVIMSYVIWRYI